MDSQLETVLPGGFKEVKRSGEKPLPITSNDMPWLGKDRTTEAPLVLVTLETGKEFLFGNAIRGNLQSIIEKGFGKDERRNQIANELLYKRLQAFFQGGSSDIRTIQNPITEGRQIYYVGNREGIRVFFMHFGEKNGIPVIIRIAACPSKNLEYNVLKVISADKNPRT